MSRAVSYCNPCRSLSRLKCLDKVTNKITAKYQKIHKAWLMSDKLKMISGLAISALGLFVLFYALTYAVSFSLLAFSLLLTGSIALGTLGVDIISQAKNALRDPEIPFPGFYNSNYANCWINSLMQSIIAIPDLKEIFQNPPKNLENLDNKAATGLFSTLKKAIDQYDLATKNMLKVVDCDTQEIRLALHQCNNSISKNSRQEDVDEAFQIITSLVEQVYPKNPVVIPVRKYTELRQEGVDQIEVTGDNTTPQIPKVVLRPPKPKENSKNQPLEFETLFNDNFENEINIPGTVTVNNQTMNIFRSSELIRFDRPPQVLAIQAGRFYQAEVKPSVKTALKKEEPVANKKFILKKNHTPINFPLNFTIRGDWIGSNRNQNYQLNAFVVHIGSINGGHYVSYRKDIKTNKWYKVNDSNVTLVPNDQVKKHLTKAYECFYTRTA